MIKKFLASIFAIGILVSSCSNEDEGQTTARITLNLNGLEELGADYVYEGWIIVNGIPVSIGTFS
ncbi:anti-sigma factor [Tamlana flava]|uniref:anti-sigma factor n=1 Tax=Tamlana flava TaxID=3158572 RepID=UPI00351AE16A